MHILNAPIFERKGLWSFVDTEKREFHYRKMLQRCSGFSKGEYRLLEVAASLFNEEIRINLWSLVNSLDSASLRLVLEAIAISRGDTTVEDRMRERMEKFVLEKAGRDAADGAVPAKGSSGT